MYVAKSRKGSSIIALQKTKYLGVSLTKEVKKITPRELHNTTEEIKGITSKLKNSLCSWIGKFYILKIAVLPKAL